MKDILREAKKNMILKEKFLSKYACKSKDGILIKEDSEDIRPIFFRDIDRIIHSSGYTRYIDKTQVYSFVENDHITKRVLHVQLVSKIARTIGRSLNLNEDLIEAISLGHDIGHTPFGHEGERILNSICKKENIGYFYHNAQSVKVLSEIEELNISLQTLDGILAHNGEMLLNQNEYNPKKSLKDFKEDYFKTQFTENYSNEIIPMTLEGATVKISDVIAYIGRDIEDAITVGAVKREDIPEEITKILGNNNSKIVDTLIKDIIQNSMGKRCLTFSKDVFLALRNLQNWNYENIYHSDMAQKNHKQIEMKMKKLYEYYLEKLTKDKFDEYEPKTNSEGILYNFIKKRNKQGENLKRSIIDYIAGQTDKFFLKECEINVPDNSNYINF